MGDYERATRTSVYKKLLHADCPFLSAQRIGHAENTLMADVDRATKLLANLTNSILQVSSLAIYVTVAIAISPEVTAATLITGGALLYFFRPLIRRNREYSAKTVDLNKRIAHDVNESIIGIKSVKIMNREDALSDRMARLFNYLRDLKIKRTLISSATTEFIQPVSVIFVVLVFIYAFYRPGFDLATFAVVMFLIQRIFIYVDRGQTLMHEINQQLPHATYLVNFLGLLEGRTTGVNGEKPFAFGKEIVFDHVSFVYESERTVLKDVTFSIKHGEMVGIIGPSGVGKTTVVDLIMRLLDPSDGKITVDGVPLDRISTKEWRSHIGYVPQDIFLLNESIFQNIRFFDHSVSPDDVRIAIRDAKLDEVVAALPQGIETNVGERGVALSAGQRQRIVLARALARKPDILILDEATSSLDAESESVIHEALEAIRGKVTVIIIAHRLSTIMNADTLVALEGGQIVEHGTPDALLKNPKSYFYRLRSMQT